MLESDKPWYEGMNDEAASLWRKFLRLYQTDFESFSYNVRIGQGLDPGPSASDATRAQWKALTSKRADVVATRAGQTWAIEVEPRVTARTVGQVVTYRHLLPDHWPVLGTLVSAIVCERCGYDMGQVLIKQNILWFKFPPAGAPSLPGTFLPSAGVPLA